MERERKREIVGVWNGKGERETEEEEKEAVMISPWSYQKHVVASSLRPMNELNEKSYNACIQPLYSMLLKYLKTW